jgi:hypothetical protein
VPMIAGAGLGTAVMTLLMSVSLLSVGVSIGFVIAGLCNNEDTENRQG